MTSLLKIAINRSLCNIFTKYWIQSFRQLVLFQLGQLGCVFIFGTD